MSLFSLHYCLERVSLNYGHRIENKKVTDTFYLTNLTLFLAIVSLFLTIQTFSELRVYNTTTLFFHNCEFISTLLFVFLNIAYLYHTIVKMFDWILGLQLIFLTFRSLLSPLFAIVAFFLRILFTSWNSDFISFKFEFIYCNSEFFCRIVSISQSWLFFQFAPFNSNFYLSESYISLLKGS